MLRPLTFRVTDYPGPYKMSPSFACVAKRRGLRVEPNRPIVPEDFRSFDQCCDLGVLGYSSLDFRPKYEHKPYIGSAYASSGERDRLLNDAYASLALDRVAEYTRIGKAVTVINGVRTELFNEHLHVLDEAVLEVYRRRALV